MNKMSDSTRTEVTESAVMQSLSENQYIRDYCESHNPPISLKTIVESCPSSKKDADMQILESFVNSSKDNGKFQIRDYYSFGDSEGHSILVSNGSDTYVAFTGTDTNEWRDNGEAFYQESSPFQDRACDRFDYYATSPEFADIMNSENNIYVTGHSKGGNKAMYVTMNSEYGNLIKGCVSLDGQGFSPEAIEYWKQLYGDTGEYEARVNKIISVSGQNDFVNELGISIVNENNRYVVDYNEMNTVARIPLMQLGMLDAGYKDTIFSFHAHQYMFQQTFNPKTGKFEFTCNLNKDAKPGQIQTVLTKFMNQYMSLSQDERKNSAPAVMNIFQKMFGGKSDEITKEDIDGIFTALLQTSLGDELIASFAAILTLISPWLSIALALYCAKLIQEILTKKQKVGKVDQLPVSASKEILLDQELFMDMQTSFNAVFDQAKEAAVYARQAESITYESGVCDGMVNTVSQKAEDINEIIVMVVDSFSAVDRENAKKASVIGEAFLGSEICTMAV